MLSYSSSSLDWPIEIYLAGYTVNALVVSFSWEKFDYLQFHQHPDSPFFPLKTGNRAINYDISLKMTTGWKVCKVSV